MFSKTYSVLSEDEDGYEEKALVFTRRTSIWTRIGPFLAVAFLTSLVANLLALYRSIDPPPPTEPRTQFAGLAWDVPTTINYTSIFNHPDREVEDAAWQSELVRPAVLAVALDDTYAEAQGLLHSMRWPWDDNKGVYALSGGHQLHCLHMLRDAVNDGQEGVTPRWPRPHLMHCLEYLLQNVMCFADDTPLYTGWLHDNVHGSGSSAGSGTTRMCRDWTQLQAWARERSACYDSTHDPDVAEIDKYKRCPDDDRPWEKIARE